MWTRLSGNIYPSFPCFLLPHPLTDKPLSRTSESGLGKDHIRTRKARTKKSYFTEEILQAVAVKRGLRRPLGQHRRRYIRRAASCERVKELA